MSPRLEVPEKGGGRTRPARALFSRYVFARGQPAESAGKLRGVPSPKDTDLSPAPTPRPRLTLTTSQRPASEHCHVVVGGVRALTHVLGDTQIRPVAPSPFLPLCCAPRSPGSPSGCLICVLGPALQRPLQDRGPATGSTRPVGAQGLSPVALSSLEGVLELAPGAHGGCRPRVSPGQEGAGGPRPGTPPPQPTPLMPGKESKTQPSLFISREENSWGST